MDSTSENSVSPSHSILTLSEEEWLVVPVTETDKDAAMLSKSPHVDTIKDQAKLAKEELEILEEVLEATRAAFRQEQENTERIKGHLATVTQKLEATKDIFAKEVADAKLKLAAVEKDFRYVNSHLQATKDASKKEIQDAKLELAIVKEDFRAVKSQLEAANYALNEKQDKVKSQAVATAALSEKVKDGLVKKLEATEVQLATARQELVAAKSNLIAAKDAAMTAEGAITEELEASEVQLSSAKQELAAAKSGLVLVKKAATTAEVAIKKELDASKQDLRATKYQLDTTKRTFTAAKSEWTKKQETALKEFERFKQAYELNKSELEAHKQKFKVAKQELEVLQSEKTESAAGREKLGNKLRAQVETATVKHEQAKKVLVDIKESLEAQAKRRAEERKTKEDAADQAINSAATQAVAARKQHQDMFTGWVVSKEAMATFQTRFQVLNDRYLAQRKAFSDLKQSHEAKLKKEVEERKVLEAEAEKRVKVAAAHVAAARKELQKMTENDGKGPAVEVQFADGRQARPYWGGAK